MVPLLLTMHLLPAGCRNLNRLPEAASCLQLHDNGLAMRAFVPCEVEIMVHTVCVYSKGAFCSHHRYHMLFMYAVSVHAPISWHVYPARHKCLQCIPGSMTMTNRSCHLSCCTAADCGCWLSCCSISRASAALSLSSTRGSSSPSTTAASWRPMVTSWLKSICSLSWGKALGGLPALTQQNHEHGQMQCTAPLRLHNRPSKCECIETKLQASWS